MTKKKPKKISLKDAAREYDKNQTLSQWMSTSDAVPTTTTQAGGPAWEQTMTPPTEMSRIVDMIQKVFGDVVYEMDGEYFCPVCMATSGARDAMTHDDDCSLGALMGHVNYYCYPVSSLMGEAVQKAQQQVNRQYSHRVARQLTQLDQATSLSKAHENIMRYGSATIGGPPIADPLRQDAEKTATGITAKVWPSPRSVPSWKKTLRSTLGLESIKRDGES